MGFSGISPASGRQAVFGSDKASFPVTRPVLRLAGAGKDQVHFGQTSPLYPSSRTFTEESNGTRLHLRQWWAPGTSQPEPNRKAPVILIVHGLSGRSAWMSPVADELMKRPFAKNALVYGLDIPEIGQNENPSGKIEDLKPLVTQVREAVKLLSQKGDVHLVGLSLGGLLSTAVAAEKPEGLKSLTLLSPALKPHKDRLSLKVLLSSTFQTIKGKLLGKTSTVRLRDEEKPLPTTSSPKVTPLQARIAQEKLTATDKVDKLEMGSYFKLFGLMHKVRNRLAKQIEVPVRVYATEEDDLVDIAGVRKAFQKIGSADKQLTVFEKGCHDLTGDPHLPAIADALDAFFANPASAG